MSFEASNVLDIVGKLCIINVLFGNDDGFRYAWASAQTSSRKIAIIVFRKLKKDEIPKIGYYFNDAWYLTSIGLSHTSHTNR